MKGGKKTSPFLLLLSPAPWQSVQTMPPLESSPWFPQLSVSVRPSLGLGPHLICVVHIHIREMGCWNLSVPYPHPSHTYPWGLAHSRRLQKQVEVSYPHPQDVLPEQYCWQRGP